MKCTGKEWDTCRVEKMGCKGCHYDKLNTEEVIKGLEDLIADRESFINPSNINDEDNVFVKDKRILTEAINIIKKENYK